jgi:hypothetical protein
LITGQPGPLMCPGCSTTLGTPPASVSRWSSASISALPTPYSPYGVRGSRAAAERDHLMSRADQPRDQVGADMTGGADDDDSTHARTSLPHPDLAARETAGS